MAILKKYNQDPPEKKYSPGQQYMDSLTISHFSKIGVDKMTAKDHEKADQAYIRLAKELKTRGIKGPLPDPKTNQFKAPKPFAVAVDGNGNYIETKRTIKL